MSPNFQYASNLYFSIFTLDDSLKLVQDFLMILICVMRGRGREVQFGICKLI